MSGEGIADGVGRPNILGFFSVATFLQNLRNAVETVGSAAVAAVAVVETVDRTGLGESE